ncbi:LapA family protein [Mameliella sediminis]|uniref:LapA family protein n=1 Tax=Mameliella sediminis TaxID=2836866 RepID=UPI001C46E654|nr:LapA family protein [Mameliella sediminis]MBY6113369.1 LapA family protein [Antarctobacter heliothermus]MBY6143283.1 LapA family protein [Mameliella alba]MBV7394667.1 LapA family protein [Mameliella sediminis]MBY6163116.1 LapA family protein [Mameliella alba]MBY6171380.1 LapA family protein [Mameliella alba]
MRYIRYAFLAALAVALITVALANRATVTLNTLPEGLARVPGMDILSFSIEMPLFLAIFAGIVAGLLIGFVWEWLREYKHRAEASAKKTEVRKLERQLKKTQAERDKDKDEVLAILDQAS